MKAVRLFGAGDLRLVDDPEPVAGPGESLVRVDAVGLCGSDLHWFGEGGIGDAVVTTRPLVLGHEVAGTALTGLYAGRLVAVDPAHPCGRCGACRAGHGNLCPAVRFLGHGDVDGGLRQTIAWPDRLLVPLPDGMSAVEGAVLEPLGVALHAWDLSHARPGESVAVVGCGPIGLLLIQLAVAAGASEVVAVEPLAHRRQAAVRYGASRALTPDQAREASAWTPKGELRGADVVFEVAGTDDALAISCIAARLGGKVLITGIPETENSSFPAAVARRKGLTLALVRRMKEMYGRTVQLVASGRVDASSVVTSTFGLDAYADAFNTAAHRDGLKVVLDPNG